MNSRCKAVLAPQSQRKLLCHISSLSEQITSLQETVDATYSFLGPQCPYGLLHSLAWCIQDPTSFEAILIKLFLNLHYLSHEIEPTLSYTVCSTYTTTVSGIYGVLHRTGTIWPWTASRQLAGPTHLPLSQTQRSGPNKCKHRGRHDEPIPKLFCKWQYRCSHYLIWEQSWI